MTSCDSESYRTINNIRINFNNQAGLLSSMSQQQLYANSVLSGLNNISFDEFKGTTISVAGRGPGISAPVEPYSHLGAVARQGGDQTDPDPGVHFGAELWRSHPADGRILCTRQFRDRQLAITSGGRK